jgi:Secretion system C-terminal sorting domain/Ig-like domain CHU_C associated
MKRTYSLLGWSGNVYKRFCAALIGVVGLGLAAQAQVSTYSFSQTSGTYTAVSGGTVLGIPGNDDTSFPDNPIGFTFWYNGTAYTKFSVNANGFLALGSTVLSSYNSLSLGSTNNVISAQNADIQGDATNGNLQFITTGTAPNRTLVVQWTNYDDYPSSSGTDVYNFQIRLSETSNVVNVVYGTTSSNQLAGLFEVGLRGASSADFNNRLVTNGVQTWATSIAGTANSSTCEMNVGLVPASGQTYTWTPPASPAAPTTLTFTAVTQSAMTLNWVDNSTNETSFFVERSLDNITFVPAGSVTSTTTAATGGAYTLNQTGLFSATLYYYRIYAVAITPSLAVSGSQATLPGTLCGTFTVGPTGAYTSLTAAFAAVATNGVSCPLVFDLQAAYVSTVETFPLTIPFLGNGPTNTITVRPEIGATNLSITSNALQTINFNGTNYVSFDGRPGSVGTVSHLTIENTATTGAAVQIGGDAINCGLNYIKVRGVNTGTAIGTVQFTAPATVNGSVGHFITNCEFAPGATNPQQFIFSANGLANSFISATVSNNTFRDWFIATGQNAALNLGGNIRNWTISNNSFYQTATRTYTTGVLHYGILISGTAAGSGGHNISGNFIGGTAVNAGGTAWTIAGAVASRFVGISVNGNSSGNLTPTSIQGNTITNFNLTTTSGATTSPGIFCGIQTQGTSHNLNVGTVTPNIIGSTTATGAIVTSCSTNGGLSMGISNTSSGAVVISNNQVGGFTCNSSVPTISSSFTGIQSSSGSPSTISNNLVGSLTIPNSVVNAFSTSTTAGIVMGINSSAFSNVNITGNTVMNLSNQYSGTSTAGLIRGIYSTSGINVINGNTVRNLACLAPNASTAASASVQGITLATFSTSVNSVNSNTINTLANGSSTGNVMVSGITIAGTVSTFANTSVAYNNIAGMGAPLSSGTPIVYGINLVGSVGRAFNNFVNLGSDITGAAITAPNTFVGINKETSQTFAVNFNTVNINGAGVTGGAANTFAYRRVTTGGADSLFNNILVNTRSNGTSSGTHYSVSVNNNTTFNSDNNDYFGNGTGYQTGIVNSVNVTGVSGMILAVGGNGNSISVNPNFISATNLHINNATVTALESRALTLAYVPNDIDLQVRPGPTAVNGGGTAPDMGADEFDGIPLATDIGAFSFLQPAVPGCYSATQTIRVRVRNYAGTALNMALPGNGVTVTATVTGPNPQSFTLGPITSGIIPAAGFLDTTLTTTYNMSAAGVYGFTASATTASEVLTLNDGFGPLTITVSGGTATANGSGRICLGNQGTLSVAGYTVGGTIQWQESPDNITWTNIPAATNPTLAIIPTDTTFYRAVICGQHNSVVDTLFPAFVAPPTTAGATRCGTGPVTLTAAGSGTLNWYNQPTAGTQLASGTTFTPTVSSTTTYYVENSTGTPPTTITTTFAAGNGSTGNVFRVSALNTITITGFDGHMTSGTATWEIWGRPGDYTTVPGSTTSNAGWTLLGSAANVTAAGLGVPTPLPITLNLTIPGGTDYSFVVTTTATTLNYTNGTAVGNPLFTNTDMIVREGHGGSYFGYTITTRNWNGRIRYSAGCSSFPRTPVIATVTPAPAIAAVSSNTICGSGSTTLSVSSSNAGYNYSWLPATALNTTTGDTVVSSPVTSTTYVVQATDTVSGCVTFDTIQAQVAPAVIGTATVSNDTICGGTQVQLDVAFPPAVFTVGNQNVLNTTTSYPSPFGQFYWGAKHQMLITAAELQAAGMTAGFYNSLGFQLPTASNTPAPSPALQNFEIRIANTLQTSMTTAFQMTGFTSFYTNASLTPTTGVMTLNFSSNWYWDGVSNIIVETCFNNTSFTSNWVFRQSTTSYASTAVLNQDASGVCSAASGFSTFFQRPNMIFTRSSGNNSYVWTGGTVSNNAIQNPTATPLASSSYIVLVTDTLTGCNLTDTVSVHVLPTPAPNFGADTVICSNTPLVLDGTAGNDYVYIWQDSVTITQTFSVNSFGIYSVFVTDTANGCTGTDTILVGVDAAPSFSLGADVTLCAGNSATFSGPSNALYTYNWSTSANTTNTEVVNTAGNVALLVTDTSNGCFENDTAVVFVNPLPVIALGNDTAICSNNSPLILNGPSGPYSYMWQDSSLTQNYTVTTSGSYNVTVTDTATTCFSNDTVLVTINASPAPALGSDSTFCSANAPLVLSAPSGPFDYQWQDASTGNTFSAAVTGVYSVLVTDSITGCSASDSVNITVNTSPVVNLGADTTLCGTSFVLNGPAGNLNYAWTPSGNTPSITVTTSGSYSLVATDSISGCAGSDNINVVLNAPPVVTLSLSFDTLCNTGDTIVLTGGSPASGTWSGPGVSGNVLIGNALSPGTISITYTYTDINGCTNIATDNVVVDPCTGVAEQTAVSAITVYPNPNTGLFTLNFKGADYTEMSIEVVTLQGQLLWSDMSSNVQGDVTKQLDLTNYSNGIYYVRVVADGQTFVQKVVKQD